MIGEVFACSLGRWTKRYAKKVMVTGRGADMASVTINIKVAVDIYQDGGLFIADCKRFGVITQGNTFEEARNNLIEALSLFVETCFEMGTLESILKESGFSSSSKGEIDVDNCPDHIELSLPFFASNHLRECRA